MSQKDYRAIAAALNKHVAQNPDAVRSIALELCDTLQRDNRRFDSARFLEACLKRSN